MASPDPQFTLPPGTFVALLIVVAFVSCLAVPARWRLMWAITFVPVVLWAIIDFLHYADDVFALPSHGDPAEPWAIGFLLGTMWLVTFTYILIVGGLIGAAARGGAWVGTWWRDR